MRRFFSLLSLLCISAVTTLAQDPTQTDPRNYKVEFENDRVRVIRVKVAPKGKSPMHSHPDNVVVAVTDTNVRHTLPDGKTQEAQLKAGQVIWNPAFSHAGENLGDKPMEVLLVELKPAAAAAATGDAEKALTQMEHDWGKALLGKDTAALERIMASDWTLTDPMGMAVTRAQSLEDLRSGTAKFDSYEVGDVSVRVFGDTAIVSGTSTEKSIYKGRDTSGKYRFTDVFVRRNGQWQAVSTHVTRVTPQ